jgi:hypothetical protein
LGLKVRLERQDHRVLQAQPVQLDRRDQLVRKVYKENEEFRVNRGFKV